MSRIFSTKLDTLQGTGQMINSLDHTPFDFFDFSFVVIV